VNKGLGLAAALAAAALVAGVFMLSRSDEAETGGAVPLAASRNAPTQAPGFDAPLDGAQPVTAQPLAVASAVTPPVTTESSPGAPSAAVRPAGEALMLTGRVLDEAGRPVPGARVTFVAEPLQASLGGRIPGGRGPRSPVEDLPSSETGPDGRFTLEGVLPPPSDEVGNFILPGMQPMLVVQHDAFATLEHSCSGLQPPRHELGDLLVAAGAWITGRAVDENGRPLAGARATAHVRELEGGGSPRGFGLPFGGLSERLDEALSGPDGRFRIAGLAPGKADVTVRAEGRRVGTSEGVELMARQPADVGDIALPTGQSIAGVVLDERGQPLADAEVSVSSMARIMVNRLEDLPRSQLGQEFGQRARTDAAGAFEVSGLAGGHYTVHVRAEGFDSLLREDVAAGTRDLRLVPVRLGGLLVRVNSDRDGAPVSGARLRATPVADEQGGPRFFRDRGEDLPVLAGAAALAAAGVEGDPAGAYWVRNAGLAGTEVVVAADGFATLEATAAPVASGAQGRLDVRLVPESVVAGRVLDTRGQPLAEARVTLAASTPEEPELQGAFRGGFRRGFRIEDRDADEEPLDAGRLTTRTHSDGSFELRGAAPGDWNLSATHPDCVDGAPLPLTLAAGEQRAGLELPLQPAGTLAGLVTEHDGTPSVDIEVTATPAAEANRADPGSQDVTLEIGRALHLDDGTGRRFARTDDAGRWSIGGLAEGEYQVTLGGGARRGRSMGGGGMVFAFAGDPGEATQGPKVWAKVVAGEETTVNLVRPKRGSVHGRVLAGGQPVPDARVTLSKRREGQDSPFAFAFPFGGGDDVRTDERGEYRFDDVEAGAYEVSASVPGAPLERSADFDLDAGDSRSADLVFGGSTLKGKVVDKASGAGAPGVLITAIPVKDQSADQPLGQASVSMVMIATDGGPGGGMTMEIGGGGPASQIRSAPDGSFELRWVEPGHYRLEASGGGYTEGALGPVEVADGQDKDDLRLEVERGAIVLGTVLSGETGERLDGVPVQLEGLDTRRMEVTSGGGRYRFEGLAAGEYTVNVLGSGLGSDFGGTSLASEDVELELGETRELDLTTGT
jgi:protocatechuate 3,4-dioxygenase beta subunit